MNDLHSMSGFAEADRPRTTIRRVSLLRCYRWFLSDTFLPVGVGVVHSYIIYIHIGTSLLEILILMINSSTLHDFI